jgi:hypothetical protein
MVGVLAMTRGPFGAAPRSDADINAVLPRVAILALALVACACDQRAAFERFVPKQEAALGRRLFDEIRRREFGSVELMLSAELAADGSVRAQLEQLAKLFPSEEPIGVLVVGAFTNTINDTRIVTMTYEYRYQQQWILANIVLRQSAGRQVIEGLHVQPAPDSQERLNAFTFRNKGPAHYVMVAASIAIPVFIVATFIVVLRTRGPRRRWLWALAVLFGVGQVSFNWTSGEADFRALHVVLLGGAFFKAGPYGPLTLMCAFPVGAFCFLWKRQQWLVTALQPPSDHRDTDRLSHGRE